MPNAYSIYNLGVVQKKLVAIVRYEEPLESVRRAIELSRRLTALMAFNITRMPALEM